MRIFLFVLLGLGAMGGFLTASDVFVRGTDTAEEKRAASESPAPLPEPPIAETFIPSSREVLREPASETVAKEIAPLSCERGTSTYKCYEEHYTKSIQSQGIAAAVADLKGRYAVDSYAKSQCHPLMHLIGRISADQFKTVGEAYKYGDSFCWSGYYHGVLESFIGKVGLADLRSRLNDVCTDIPGKERYSFDYYNCVHGLGHGVMAVTNTELFESLTYCDSLVGAWEQVSCASGSFMENIIVDGLNHVTKYLKPEEPLYPCTASPEKYKQTCYLMQTSYMLKVNGGNFAQTFQRCREVEEAHRTTCFNSLGRDASGRSSSDIEKTKVTCLLGQTTEEQTYCATGAVKDFISYYHSDKEGKAFCNSFENKEIATHCLAEAATYYGFF